MSENASVPALETIFARRSCRSFTGEAVSRADLETLARAALHAPSARNLKQWQFTVLETPHAFEPLRAALAALREDASYGFYGARALIVCSCERTAPYGREDCACAMENILLAACALGLGGVWINQLFGNCDKPELRAVLDGLGVPENHLVYGCAALGHPAGKPESRAPRGSIVWRS